jgi:hypothetical protein
MDDAEYLWEPVPECWTIRLVDGRWQGDVGPDGTEFSAPDPPPFTTIAWRLWHLGAADLPGWPPADVPDGPSFVTAWFQTPPSCEVGAVGAADEAVALLDRNWERFATRVGQFSDEELAAPMGPAAGQWADASLHGLLLHVVDELIHHGAEVALLRDLYARRP